MAMERKPYRVGSHSQIMIWHDPDPAPGEQTGEPIAMATTPLWARRIADALNAAEQPHLSAPVVSEQGKPE